MRLGLVSRRDQGILGKAIAINGGNSVADATMVWEGGNGASRECGLRSLYFLWGSDCCAPLPVPHVRSNPYGRRHGHQQ